MEITTHRSEKQMMKDYALRGGTDESRANTTRLMNDFVTGRMARMPPTILEQSVNTF